MEIDNIKNDVFQGRKNKYYKKIIPMFTSTPLILEFFGVDKDDKIHASEFMLGLSWHTIQNIIEGKHQITFDILKRLPVLIIDPIAIYDSSNENEQPTIVFILDIIDVRNRPVIMPMQLTYINCENKRIPNIILSVYGLGNEKISNPAA
ncbi:MAG: hypothetical protein LBR22_00695 [Desulfovibrio sp.]|jgi:hypothetical protein|nr:hypothetical protein [Desulfovibrio sp.]